MFKKLLVVAAAFTAGLLLAPKSGRDTRRDLKSGLDRKVKEMKAKVNK
jgi:gas vesicle protein